MTYSTVQYSTVQYSTVQYSAVRFSTVQYSTVQYRTVHYNHEWDVLSVPLENLPWSAAAIWAPVTTPGTMYTTKLHGMAEMMNIYITLTKYLRGGVMLLREAVRCDEAWS